MFPNRRAVICSKREAEELVFWTTCGPATTFDPKIAGPDGTWFFDDGTTISAASGEGISKTFASEGLHRAVYRPVGGLAAITGILAESDLLVGDHSTTFARCANMTNLTLYTNTSCVWSLDRVAGNGKIAGIVCASSGCRGNLSSLQSRPITYLDLGYNSNLVGTLADVPGTITQYVKLMNCSGISGSIADLATPTAQTVYLYSNAGITAGSVSALVAIRDLRIYSMGWLTADVDTVIDSMWTARAAYTYATPALNIGGTNEAPTGNVIAPVEGDDWHQDGATWIPLTAGAKAYDLAKDVNSEGFNQWTITYTGGSIAPSSTLLDSLQVLYDLDEAAGTQRNDSIDALHLSDNGTVAQIDGPAGLGKAAGFTAASNHFLYRISSQNTVLMPRATDFAISAWLWNAGSGSLEYYWGGGLTEATDAGIRIGKDASNKIACYFCDGSTSRIAIVASEAIPLSAWVHVVLNFDRDGNCQIFYNGVSKGTTAISAQPGDINPNITFNIGRTPSGGNNWNGGIAQVMKHSRLLTSAEMTELYNAGAGKAYPF